jgi:predicted membrane channel-forming protein YqfA (hemolysin III family)
LQRSEERLNAATHAFGAVLGVVGLVFLVIQADKLDCEFHKRSVEKIVEMAYVRS